MNGFASLYVLLVPIVHCLTLRKEDTVFPRALDDECDPSSIPVMSNFDMKRFSGAWFELAKSASGYIEVNDGMWKILTNNASSSFLFTGRDNNGHCIRPIKGKIHPIDQPPGLLKLQYQTYSTHVEETIRVLFTDYSTFAVVYLCMYHVHREKEICHAAGMMGAVWTRHPHVELSVYENALRYLEMACVHRSILILRNQVGSCKVDDLGFRVDDFPAPDYCYQLKDIGYCLGNIQRYYYDPKEKRCEIFPYSGCGGNRNNFMSLPQCQESCLTASSKEPICASISKCAIHCPPCCTENRIGCVECNCEHVVEGDFLNCKKSPAYCLPECAVEEFYPSCYICSCGKENEPFVDTPDPACIEVREKGSCNGEIERYFYNAKTGECEIFIFSGCNGNNNNFRTLNDCLEKCKGYRKFLNHAHSATGKVEWECTFIDRVGTKDTTIQKSEIRNLDDEEDDSAINMKYNGLLVGSILLLYFVFVPHLS